MGRLEYDRFGGPELILRASFALPQAQANETAVRAAVASINAMDWKIRSGEMKMCTGSKVIRAMGTDFALGNRADSQPDCSRSFVERWARTSRVRCRRQVSDLKPGDAVQGTVTTESKPTPLEAVWAIAQTLRCAARIISLRLCLPPASEYAQRPLSTPF